MKQILLLIILIITGLLYPQEYQITSVPVNDYSVDRYEKEIYYRHEITGEIYKTNSTGTMHSITEFQSVPRFANNSHSAVHVNDNDLYLYDFDLDSSLFLANSNYFNEYVNLLFSPSDNKIFISTEIFDNNYEPRLESAVYYSFEDSSVHNLNTTIYYDQLEWLTDTSVVYISLGRWDIRTLNTNNLNTNILVSHADTVGLWGLANNPNIGAFAYSWEYNTAENTLINLYYPHSSIDTVVYNFIEQGPFPGNFQIYIRELSWEKRNNKLAFIGQIPLITISLIYVFDYQTSQTNLYTNPWTTGEGNKYNLQWLNKDTVIYSDFNDFDRLFGLAVTTPVDVKPELSEVVREYNLAQNFPNPFNSSTIIKFQISEPSLVNIKIYDFLGREVATLVSEEKTTGNYSVEFNATGFTSGIYFYQMQAGGYTETKKMILLK